MLITLNNGKTVDISWERYDAMSDDEYKYFLDDESGDVINDPFLGSQIDIKEKKYNSSSDFENHEDHD